MNILASWGSGAGGVTLGLTLLHSLWEGAAIALSLKLLLTFLQSARTRYAVSCLAMLGLLAILAITALRVMPDPVPPIPLPLLAAAVPAGQSGGLPSPDLPKPWTASIWLPWLANAWFAGVLLFHLRSARGWFAIRRLRRTGVCAPDPIWQRRVETLCARLQLTRPVTLLESSLAEVPVVLGHLRPIILMPVGLLAGLPAGQVEAILLHELAHVRRFDYLINLLQIFVEGLLYYHPAIWWISGQIRAERENCCDDLVVSLRGGAFEYATALAALEHHRSGPREALASTGGSLVKRIRRLLGQIEQPRPVRTPVLTVSLLIVTLVTALAAWQSQTPQRPRPLSTPAHVALAPQITPPTPQRKQDPAPLAQAAPLPLQLETPYRKWMVEDVAYIITDAERTAFKALPTDAEREHFIEQFWLRRDPTPGTVENEMKEEHYRRIAYANQHYDAGIPGWKTDRGRIYIQYGPPDEKETHPNGTASQFPFEQWLYRYLPGIGTSVVIEFVDPTRSGEFRMALDPSVKDALRAVGPPLGQVPSVAKAGATVQLMGTSAALISVPLAAFGNHLISISGSLATTGQNTILLQPFEATIQGPAPLYTRWVAVQPGSYRLDMSVKDLTTGLVSTDLIPFEVK